MLFPEKGSGKEEINADSTSSAGKSVPAIAPPDSNRPEGSARTYLTDKDFLGIPDRKAISQKVASVLNGRPI